MAGVDDEAVFASTSEQRVRTQCPQSVRGAYGPSRAKRVRRQSSPSLVTTETCSSTTIVAFVTRPNESFAVRLTPPPSPRRGEGAGERQTALVPDHRGFGWLIAQWIFRSRRV